MNINTDATGEQDNERVAMLALDIRNLSAEQFAKLGMAEIAYVRPVIVNGNSGFAIHAADGTPMAVAGDRDLAVAAILQHEMVPTSVH
jgi:hypothetical protein